MLFWNKNKLQSIGFIFNILYFYIYLHVTEYEQISFLEQNPAQHLDPIKFNVWIDLL